jgi:hypothetical protein
MDPISEKCEQQKGTMKETVPDEKHIMQCIAAKPLSEQEQSVNLL